MRLQTKSPDPESALKPSRKASQAANAQRRRGPGSPRSGARRQVRRCVGSSAKSLRQKGQDSRSGGSDRGTPPIPLTLRGMQGAPRSQARSSARFFFLLPSVLALLALVLFPVAAHADCTAACSTYEVEVPSVESTPKTTPHKSATPHKSPNNPKAEGSGATTGTGGGNTGGTGTEPEGEGQKPSGEGSSKEGGGNPPTKGGGGGGGNNAGGGNGGGGQPEGGVGEAEPVSQSAAESSSGGSSPVVPILIAVAVLAAISIGVVLYRQRKSDQDTDGGADGSVSSPNAS
jgi:cobalamin biosynthesis Mg chelatase CobN